MNSITNSVAAKQVIDRIINELFDSSPKWWEPNEPLYFKTEGVCLKHITLRSATPQHNKGHLSYVA
jgi:hypothetical protein